MKKLIILLAIAMCAGCTHIDPNCKVDMKYSMALTNNTNKVTRQHEENKRVFESESESGYYNYGSYSKGTDHPDQESATAYAKQLCLDRLKTKMAGWNLGFSAIDQCLTKNSCRCRETRNGDKTIGFSPDYISCSCRCVYQPDINKTVTEDATLKIDTKLKICIAMGLALDNPSNQKKQFNRCTKIPSIEKDGNVKLELWTLQLGNYIKLQDYVNTTRQAGLILNYINEITNHGRYPEGADKKLRSRVFISITPQIECIANVAAIDAWVRMKKLYKTRYYLSALSSSRCEEFNNDADRIRKAIKKYEAAVINGKAGPLMYWAQEIKRSSTTRTTKKTSQDSIFDYCRNNPNECFLGGFMTILVGTNIYESVKANHDQKQSLREVKEQEEHEQHWCAENPHACAQKRKREQAKEQEERRRSEVRQSCHANCEAQTSTAQCAGMSNRGTRRDKDKCLYGIHETRRRCKETCP